MVVVMLLIFFYMDGGGGVLMCCFVGVLWVLGVVVFVISVGNVVGW